MQLNRAQRVLILIYSLVALQPDVASGRQTAASGKSEFQPAFSDRPIKTPTLIVFGPIDANSKHLTLRAVRAVADEFGFRFEVVDAAPRWLAVGDGLGAYQAYTPEHVSSGYILVSLERSTEVVPSTGSRAMLAARIRLFLMSPWARYYLGWWPVIASILVISISSSIGIVERKRRWVAVSLIVTIVGLALFIPMELVRAANPLNNVLTRDLVGGLALAAGAPLLTGGMCRYLWRHGVRPSLRVVLGAAPALAVLAANPIILLFVHCTSGDCL